MSRKLQDGQDGILKRVSRQRTERVKFNSTPVKEGTIVIAKKGMKMMKDRESVYLIIGCVGKS